jgi:hypothetical protein
MSFLGLYRDPVVARRSNDAVIVADYGTKPASYSRFCKGFAASPVILMVNCSTGKYRGPPS